MSRSVWASTEGSAQLGAAGGGPGQRAGLGVFTRFEHRLGAACPITRLVWALAVSAAVLALGSPPVLAASGGSPAFQFKRDSPGQASAGRGRLARSGRPAAAGGLVLAPGSGYGGGSGPVRSLQRGLARAGFSPGPVDGRYGPRTERAVSRFQAASGLAVDGIAGPLTRAALRASTPGLYPGAGYGSGGSGAVRELQQGLARAGFSPGPVDGRYGPRTRRGVSRFQAAHGLPVDGIARPQTLRILRRRASGQRPRGGHSRRTPARAHPADRHPTQAPAPPSARPVSPRSGSPSLSWLGLLGALVVGLLLAGTRLTHRRPGRRVSVSPPVQEGDPPLRSPRGPAAATNGAAEHHDADQAFHHAVLLQARHDPAGAEAAYRTADQHGHRAAACNLGVLLEHQGDLAGAESAYRRAAQRGDANGAFNLAVLLEAQPDPAGAEAAYRTADQHGHAAAASNLGVLLEQKGDLAEAESAYRRADQRGDANGAFNLAVLLEEQHDLPGAEAAYRRADQRGPAEVANTARAALLDLHTQTTANATPRGDNHDV